MSNKQHHHKGQPNEELDFGPNFIPEAVCYLKILTSQIKIEGLASQSSQSLTVAFKESQKRIINNDSLIGPSLRQRRRHAHV